MLEASPAALQCQPVSIRRRFMTTMHPNFSSSAFSAFRSKVLALGLLSALVLAGCGSSSRRVSYETEEFDSTTTHPRTYAATEAQTCEAARRALLSQGYMINAANTDLVTGRKSFEQCYNAQAAVDAAALTSGSKSEASN